MQLIVIVKRLNKRIAVPETLPEPMNIIGVVQEGFRFEGEEVDPLEISNPNLGKWYKDRDEHYYWGGGLSIVPETIDVPALAKSLEALEAQPALQFDATKMSWGHKFYEIPFIWNDLKTKGEGVTVAVIDTGVDVNHSDLIPNIHPMSKSFVGAANDISDTAGHGTNMAGIIAASGSNKVFGVAPDAKILIVKATIETNGVNLKTFANAINFSASVPEVNIVSISYSLLFDDPDIKKAIQNCLDAKKIVVAAIGNRRNTSKPTDDDTFPSSYNNGPSPNSGVIAIGAFDKNGQLCSFSNWNNHLNLISPGDFSVLTTGIGNTATNGSLTSIATAFTAGCIALMVSYLKANNPQNILTCIAALLDTCDDIGPTTGFDVRSGYGRMNLRNAIAKIKTP